MKAIIPVVIFLFIFSLPVTAQDYSRDSLSKANAAFQSAKAYAIRSSVDIPIFALAAGFATYTFSRLPKKTNSTQGEVEALKQSDVNWFDRWAIRPYDEQKDNISYKPFYIAMPAPLLLFSLDKKMRKDFLKLTFLYAEAVVITGALYGGAADFTNRYRPMVYRSETPLGKRLSKEQKKVFSQAMSLWYQPPVFLWPV